MQFDSTRPPSSFACCCSLFCRKSIRQPANSEQRTTSSLSSVCLCSGRFDCSAFQHTETRAQLDTDTAAITNWRANSHAIARCDGLTATLAPPTSRNGIRTRSRMISLQQSIKKFCCRTKLIGQAKSAFFAYRFTSVCREKKAEAQTF